MMDFTNCRVLSNLPDMFAPGNNAVSNPPNVILTTADPECVVEGYGLDVVN